MGHAETMNAISFRRYEYVVKSRPWWWRLVGRWTPAIALDLIVPIVDGKPLVDHLDFDGLPRLGVDRVEPVASQWGGEPAYADDEGRAVVADGRCGIAECCGVHARILFEPDTVRWSDFTIGPYRNGDREFVFDRWLYEASLAELPPLTTERFKVRP